MRKKLKNIEWSILIIIILLFVIGIVAIYSSGQNNNYSEFRKQILWFAISVPIMILLVCIDYNFIAKCSGFFYIISIVLLVLVLFTTPINGARSWFRINGNLFQPSELSKITLVLFLPYIITVLQNNKRDEINKFWKLAISLAVVALPILLIIVQPDYGTGTSYVFLFVFTLFIAGINKKYLLVALLLVIILFPIIYLYVLPEHAKTRFEIFLNPEQDPRGAGYNILQSKLAIGAGQVFGMGLFKGNQTQLGYLYPKTTDFIFAVISEEMGFIIGVLVIILYVILITKSIYIAKTAKDDLGSYITIGIVGIFSFQMIENIGMTMGLLPITGIPLPFVSYGGSSLLTNLSLIALILNISMRRKKVTRIEK